MSLYTDIMELLKTRKVINAEWLAPLYVCSIGCHIFNIFNKKKHVLRDGELISDARLHVIMVSFPGFGKSHLIRHFLDVDIGILDKTTVDPKFLGSITTASLVGTIHKDEEGNVVKTPGICETNANSIIGINEFAEITGSMKQTYNTGLLDALLLALDDGHIIKNVVNGGLDYHTQFTLFTSIQPARHDLKSGIGRRLCYLVYIPTLLDVEKLRLGRREARNARSNIENIQKIRYKVNQKYHDIQSIKSVIFHKDFYLYLDTKHLIHYEEIIYERIAIGYWIMNTDTFNDTLNIHIDDALKVILTRQHKDRNLIKKGIDITQIEEVIKNESPVDKQKLKTLLFEFSMKESLIDSKLKTLLVTKKITEDAKFYYYGPKKHS